MNPLTRWMKPKGTFEGIHITTPADLTTSARADESTVMTDGRIVEMPVHPDTRKPVKGLSNVILRKCTSWLAIALLALSSIPSHGQQFPALSKHAEKIKKQVASYSSGAFLTVKCARQQELSGVLVSEADTSFELEESDTQQDVRVSYEDVKKVKTSARRYGKPRNSTGRAVSRVGGGVIILGLMIYLIVALHSDS